MHGVGVSQGQMYLTTYAMGRFGLYHIFMLRFIFQCSLFLRPRLGRVDAAQKPLMHIKRHDNCCQS